MIPDIRPFLPSLIASLASEVQVPEIVGHINRACDVKGSRIPNNIITYSWTEILKAMSDMGFRPCYFETPSSDGSLPILTPGFTRKSI